MRGGGGGIPGDLVVKNLPAIRKTWVQSLGWEDLLEKEGNGNTSSILAWEIPWTEEPGGLQSMGSQRVRHNWVINTFTSIYTLKDMLLLSCFSRVRPCATP